jgi:DNA-binding phage protein
MNMVLMREKLKMSKSQTLTVVQLNESEIDHFDMFSALPPLDPFDLKKDEIATQLAALMSFAKKNRSTVASSLNWEKSRMTSVLSGKGNPTIKTIYEFCGSLGFDFDLVFRSPTEDRSEQPWQKATFSEILPATVQPEYLYTDFLPVPVRLQTADEVAIDFLNGDSSGLYLSLDIASNLSKLEKIPSTLEDLTQYTPVFWNNVSNTSVVSDNHQFQTLIR